MGPSRTRLLLRLSTWGPAERVRVFRCSGAHGAQQDETSAASDTLDPAAREFCGAGALGAQQNETSAANERRGALKNEYESSAASEHVEFRRTRLVLRLSTLGPAERDFCAASEHVRPSRTRLLLRRSTLGPAEREFCCACMLLHACSGGRGGLDRPCGSKVVLIISAEYTPSFVWQRGGTKDVCYVRALRAYYLRRGRLSFEQG